MNAKRGSFSSQSSEASAWAEASGSPAGSVVSFSPLYLSPRMSTSLTSRDVMDWGFDIFTLDQETGGRCLSSVVSQVLARTGVRSDMASALIGVMQRAEREYTPSRSVSYHSHVHGADVAQALSVFMFGSSNFFASRLSASLPADVDVELVVTASICAAGLHDLGHFGVNNAFLVRTGDPLAALYGNTSVLEKHHCARAMELLIDFPFRDRQEGEFFRKLVTEMILATDLSRHHEMISDPPQVSDYRGCLRLLLHAADVSNNARSTKIASQWTERLMEEFYAQGDLERELGLPVTPIMDRHSCSVARVQIGFIDVVARPLFVAVCELVGEGLEFVLEQMDANRESWAQSLVDEGLEETREAD